MPRLAVVVDEVQVPVVVAGMHLMDVDELVLCRGRGELVCHRDVGQRGAAGVGHHELVGDGLARLGHHGRCGGLDDRDGRHRVGGAVGVCRLAGAAAVLCPWGPGSC